MKKYDYSYQLELKHNEIPAIHNVETGEVTPIVPIEYEKKKAKTTELFEPNARFQKNYIKSWNYLHDRLSALEFKVAHFLSQKAAPVTNSLAPLNDDTTVRDLAEEFSISTGKVKVVFEKLFKEGVYAKFELYQRGHEFTRYWILNPYLSFNGREIHLKTLELFRETDIAFAFHEK
jgi:hypothetical protein